MCGTSACNETSELADIGVVSQFEISTIEGVDYVSSLRHEAFGNEHSYPAYSNGEQ